MQLDTDAIVCSIRSHGEHGTIVRMLTPEHGLVAAYVRGGRGRRMRPVLIPGNLVLAQIRSRTETQLPQATVELAQSRASLLGEPLQASAIEWATALIASALPERQACPQIYQALSGLLDAIEAARGHAGRILTFGSGEGADVRAAYQRDHRLENGLAQFTPTSTRLPLPVCTRTPAGVPTRGDSTAPPPTLSRRANPPPSRRPIRHPGDGLLSSPGPRECPQADRETPAHRRERQAGPSPRSEPDRRWR